ncbi:MAG: NAD(P)/FAD-dependent oxidoreductase [Candidatus Dormibacteraceae bacterium]
MPATADLVIVGGGVIGCSLAYHLARAGERVVLLERETLGSQSTGRCAGGVRQQFSAELNVRMQRYSVARFERFADEIGHPLDFRQIGYLLLLTEPAQVTSFREQFAMWQRCGLEEARWLSAEEARRLSPPTSVDDVLAATFCPSDGIASPNDVTAGYAAAARRAGAVLVEGCAVVGLETAGGRISAVQTSQGRIQTPLCFDAAGAWSGRIAALAGIELPVEPYPRHVFLTGPAPEIARDNPMTIDMASSFYFHPEGDGVLFGMGERDERPTFDQHVDPTFLERVVGVAERRLPPLLDLGIQTSWVGLYEMTPDHQPFLGPVEEVEGFWCACGFSGHGFQMAPAVGNLLTQLLLDGRSDLDLAPFSPQRRRTGAWRAEQNVI